MVKIKSELLGGWPIWGIYKNGERIDTYCRKVGDKDGIDKSEVEEIINNKCKNGFY